MWQDAWAERELAAGSDRCQSLVSFTTCQAACRQSRATTVLLLFLATLSIHQAALSRLQQSGSTMSLSYCCTRHLSGQLRQGVFADGPELLVLPYSRATLQHSDCWPHWCPNLAEDESSQGIFCLVKQMPAGGPLAASLPG